MASWADLERAEPEFSARVRERLDAHVHKAIATLRRRGGPRISGIETIWYEGDLWFGSMPAAVKAADLLRDPRFALHSGSDDPPGWEGDAKLAGRAVEVTDHDLVGRVLAARNPQQSEPDEPIDPGDLHLFRADLDEVVWTGLDEEREKLLIEHWHPGRGLERIQR